MKLALTRSYDGAVLTTDSSAVPVLRIDGRDYGPADIVPIDPQRPTLHPRTGACVVASELADRFAFIRDGEPDLTPEELSAANRYINSDADYKW